ncbi:MAG: antitoxin family protein [Desulfurococcales archaeon]|nr:antitoxin family protein [Desulfurococcales archaeon]
MSKVIRVKYEKGVLKPLGMIEELRDGDVIVVKILGKDIAEEVFGSIKIDKERVEEVLREAEDELGMY